MRTNLGWAPEIPDHWEVVPLNAVAKMGTGHTPDRSKPEYWENCTIPWVTTPDVTKRPGSLEALMETEQFISELGSANSAAVVHPAGTVMLSRTASVGYSVQIGRPMATTQAFVTWRAGHRLDPRFLLLVLRAMWPEWERLAYGSTHLTIYMPDLESLRIPLPPLDEQAMIVEFLFSECMRMDDLQRSREKQMDLLREMEISAIGDTLGGRHVSGSRQETDWAWLPSVPSAWAIERTSRYFKIKLGKMLDAQRQGGEAAEHLPYLRNANVGWYRVETQDLAKMSFEPHELRRYSVTKGDLLVCEGGAGVAEAAVWDGRVSPCYFQKSLHRVRAFRQLPVEWLMYWLRYAKYVGLFHADGNLSTIPHLTGEQLAEYRIPIPADPLAQLHRLEDRLVDIRRTRKTLHDADGALNVRRKSLIAAGVTGQVGVKTTRGVEI